MPWQSEAKKDVLICEKRRQADMKRNNRRYPNGETRCNIASLLTESNKLIKQTKGTETSKYLEEKKSTEIPPVVASEKGTAQNQNQYKL